MTAPVTYFHHISFSVSWKKESQTGLKQQNVTSLKNGAKKETPTTSDVIH